MLLVIYWPENKTECCYVPYISAQQILLISQTSICKPRFNSIMWIKAYSLFKIHRDETRKTKIGSSFTDVITQRNVAWYIWIITFQYIYKRMNWKGNIVWYFYNKSNSSNLLSKYQSDSVRYCFKLFVCL